MLLNFEPATGRLRWRWRQRQQGWGRGGGWGKLDGVSLVNCWPAQHRNAQDFKSAPVTLKLLSLNLSFSPSLSSSFSPLASMNHSWHFFFPSEVPFKKKKKKEKEEKGIKNKHTLTQSPVFMFLLLHVAYYHQCWTNYLHDVYDALPSLRAMLVMGLTILF